MISYTPFGGGGGRVIIYIVSAAEQPPQENAFFDRLDMSSTAGD